MTRSPRADEQPLRPAGPRAEIEVDLAAIRANVAALKARAGSAQLMTVVKADGYGHGIVEVARAARAGGADWLGTAFPEEALALRSAGDTGPVLTWLHVPGEDLRPCLAAGLDVTAYSLAELDAVAAAARSLGRVARLQLKIDTGLSRGGAMAADWAALVRRAAALEREGTLRVTGVWSHLACADEPAHPANDRQEQAFREACDVAVAEGLQPEVRHLANSAATVLRPSAHFDLVRCGIATYGLSPAPEVVSGADLGLVPAMTVRTRLAVVKRIPAGSGVSYGHHYTAPHDTTVGVVPLGYADGVLRAGSSRARVLVAGRMRPVLGRICMDQFVVDLGDDPVEPGETVVLFGPGTDGDPTAQDWAEACDTISYEIVTRMGGRTSRHHVDADPQDREDA